MATAAIVCRSSSERSLINSSCYDSQFALASHATVATLDACGFSRLCALALRRSRDLTADNLALEALVARECRPDQVLLALLPLHRMFDSDWKPQYCIRMEIEFHADSTRSADSSPRSPGSSLAPLSLSSCARQPLVA